jgi:hypothetical protein
MLKDTKRQAVKDREVRLWLMDPLNYMITHCSDKEKEKRKKKEPLVQNCDLLAEGYRRWYVGHMTSKTSLELLADLLEKCN